MASPANHDPQSLIDPTTLDQNWTTYYTSPAGAGRRGTLIYGLYVIDFANNTIPPVSIRLVPSGETASDSYLYLDEYSLSSHTQGNLPAVFLMGTLLDPGDFIQVKAGPDDDEVSLHIYGVELADSGTGNADPANFNPATLLDLSSTAGASYVTMYTAPSGAGTRGVRISRIHVTNTSTTASAPVIYHVESGGTPGGEHMLVNGVSLPANKSQTFVAGIVLNPGDTIRVTGGSANMLMSIHGWEMTD